MTGRTGSVGVWAGKGVYNQWKQLTPSEALHSRLSIQEQGLFSKQN